jgi:hypothetical protein
MSRNAARAFIAGGLGVALGFGVDLGVALAVLLADPAAGLDSVVAGVPESMGDEPASGAGADGEQAKVRARRESAAAARRIPRPYVASGPRLSRASERPSGSQDVPQPELTRSIRRLLLPRAHRSNPPRTSACRLSPAHHRRAPSSATRQRGFFVGAGPVVCRRNIHNGSQRAGSQGKETRDV